jgi:betaine-aldehyde dehydrogenase
MNRFELPPCELYVGGRWEKGTGPEIVSVFPGDGSVIGS